MAPIFSIFHDSPKTSILQQVSSETLVFTSQTLPFWDQISIKISCFLESRFRTPFFPHFSKMMPKNTILGTPSGSSSGQNGAQNRPSGAKKLRAHTRRSPLLAFLDTSSGPEASQIDSDRILNDFGLILGRFPVDVLAIWINS